MNHPGVYFTILWLILLSVIIGTFQQSRYAMSTEKPSENWEEGATYICPPCGCGAHHPELIVHEPGLCSACRMPLIRSDRVRLRSAENLFKIERHVSIFHYRLLYPAYLIAFFTGFLGLFRDRKIPLRVLFYIFLLGHVFYAFKHQLWGTSYSLSVPVRWQYFPIGFLLLTAPALYLYIRNKQERIKDWRAADGWHFLPGLVVIIAYFVLFLGPSSWRYLATYNGFDHFLAVAEQFAFLVSGAYYGWLTWKLFKPSEMQTGERRWLFQLLVFQGLIYLSWFFLLFINLLLFDMMSTSLDYHLIWFLIAALSFVAAYYILFQSDQLGHLSRKKENLLTEPTLEELKQKLEKLMADEKPYLNPDLSLPLLSNQLGIKEKELSELLQKGFDSSFYAFINQYRLSEVKEMLRNPENDRYTNFALAQQAGFSSKSTFFHLFKKHVGMTPGAYKKENRS